MEFGLTVDEQRMRDAVRALADKISGASMLAIRDEMEQLGGDRMFPWHEKTQQVICEHGLVGIRWPPPWGRSASWVEEYVVEEELVAAAVPASTSQPVVAMMLARSPDLADEYVPQVLAGATRFAGGLSEPEAGSDLFALKTSARRDGDEYVVNGSKLWTSYAHESQYISTVVRTDPESSRHRGLSMLLIPTDAPGVSIEPVWVIGAGV